MPTVLTILPEGFEEIETITPVDILRRAGIDVTLAALADGIHVTGRCGMTIHADTCLSAIPADRAFDLLFLPGGPGVKNLRADPRIAARVRAQAEARRWIAAICAAPTVLHDAGLLDGRRYTAHFSVAHELPSILVDQRVVIDGNLITSRGAGTALDFAFALISQLISTTRAHEIAASICA